MEVDFAALGRWRSSIVVMVVRMWHERGGALCICGGLRHQRRALSISSNERVLASGALCHPSHLSSVEVFEGP